jgi:lysophospholipase L1-like esterase
MDMILDEMEYASPNLIILYCGYNDFFNNTITVSKSKSKLLSIIISLEKYSLFTKIAKEKIYVLKKESEAQQQKKSNHEISLEIFKKNIQKLISYTTTTKINLILIPDVLDARKFSGITKTYDDFDKKNNDIQIALKDVSEDNENVFYLNLYHLFDFENKVNDVHADVAHLTNKGYNTLSEGIFNFIIEKKVFKTK